LITETGRRAEVNDRIFSTSVNLSYTLNVSAIGGVDDLAQTEVEVQFDRVAASAKEITLEVFATDESASVQVRATHLCDYYLASPARLLRGPHVHANFHLSSPA